MWQPHKAHNSYAIFLKEMIIYCHPKNCISKHIQLVAMIQQDVFAENFTFLTSKWNNDLV